MDNERWVPAHGFPKYSISDTGKTKNSKGKLLKFYEVNGYWKVKLSKDGKEYYPRVNRLVKQTFQPRDDADQMDVDHIDFDKKNNNLNNLRWSTPKRNRSRKQ